MFNVYSRKTEQNNMKTCFANVVQSVSFYYSFPKIYKMFNGLEVSS